jgi:hypothetical protein
MENDRCISWNWVLPVILLCIVALAFAYLLAEWHVNRNTEFDPIIENLEEDMRIEGSK